VMGKLPSFKTKRITKGINEHLEKKDEADEDMGFHSYNS